MSFDEAKQAGLQRTTSVRARTERAPPRATAEHRSSITSWEAHYMRTCDCGWIADWDLGDKLSCTLYMLGSAIRMTDVGGVPEVRGRGLVRRLLGPSPCSVGRYNYFRSQTRASRLRGIYTNSIRHNHLRACARSEWAVIHRFDRTPARPRCFRHPRNGPAVIGDGAGPRRPRDRRGSINYRVYHSAAENGPRLLCASQCAASQPRVDRSRPGGVFNVQ